MSRLGTIVTGLKAMVGGGGEARATEGAVGSGGLGRSRSTGERKGSSGELPNVGPLVERRAMSDRAGATSSKP
eukprot:9128703-Alexandrium_andersonii.AAC.1